MRDIAAQVTELLDAERAARTNVEGLSFEGGVLGGQFPHNASAEPAQRGEMAGPDDCHGPASSFFDFTETPRNVLGKRVRERSTQVTDPVYELKEVVGRAGGRVTRRGHEVHVELKDGRAFSGPAEVVLAVLTRRVEEITTACGMKVFSREDGKRYHLGVACSTSSR